MTTSAIIMMLIAVLVVWGGLGLAIRNLMQQGPEDPDDGELHRDL